MEMLCFQDNVKESQMPFGGFCVLSQNLTGFDMRILCHHFASLHPIAHSRSS